jgi:oligoendopeptidase F
MAGQPTFDAREQVTDSEFGILPAWDLSDLYPAPDSAELTADIAQLETEAAAFAARYQGKLADLTPAEMLACIETYQRIDITAGRIMSYAGLRYYQNTTDAARAKMMGDLQGRITDITTPLVFFGLEFNRIPDTTYNAVFGAADGPARYKPVFDRMRAMRPHQLSDELEQFLHDTSVVGASAWNRLFDETTAALEFDVNGETLGLEATLNLLTDHDRARREAAARALALVFGRQVKLFARIHNTLAKEKAIEDKWRKMPTPQHGRHLSNHVEPEVVEALRNAVTAAYPRLSHRYYALKAKWLGLDKLQTGTRRGRRCWTPMPDFHPGWLIWPSPSSTRAGSTPP